MHRAPRILLVEDEPRLLEVLVAAVVREFDAHLTCVACGEDALDVEIIEPHTLVVAEWNGAGSSVVEGKHARSSRGRTRGQSRSPRDDKPGMDGLTLTRHLMQLNPRPVILLADRVEASEVIEALRLGACDVFTKPFALGDLLAAMQRALDRAARVHRQQTRHRRLRRLVRRVLAERRDLNQRIDLICKDLVGAHRQLVQKVLAHEDGRQKTA